MLCDKMEINNTIQKYIEQMLIYFERKNDEKVLFILKLSYNRHVSITQEKKFKYISALITLAVKVIVSVHLSFCQCSNFLKGRLRKS